MVWSFTKHAAGLSNFSYISFPSLQVEKYLIVLLSGRVYCTDLHVRLGGTCQKEASKAMTGCIYLPDDKWNSYTTASQTLRGIRS